jgi:bifunctional UDP-N-acetylglucosamine pyrophosphorylase/glucosamine-1-phosphate N-acetyltransferase
VVVVGHEADRVRSVLGTEVEYATQQHQYGTADAVLAASELFGDWPGSILVLAGDIPLIRPESFSAMIRRQSESSASLVMLTARLDDPTGYGRILRDGPNGRVLSIVEERDATPEQRAIKEWNASVYLFRACDLWESLKAVEPINTQGEFYLTDTVQILSASGARVEAVSVEDPTEVVGINTRSELAQAAQIMRRRINLRHMLCGVTMTDPANTYIDADVLIDQDTTVLPGTMLTGSTSIGSDCTIGPSANIHSSIIGKGSLIVSSQIIESSLGEYVRVGPFANLRPGTTVGNGVRIGDFVELKNSVLGDGVQVNHLSYLGDADIGEGTNIGAGTITCNYNGFTKNRTAIGKHAFVGSHSTLIAPCTVGDGAVIGAGSVVPTDVPANALAISRPPLTIKEQGAIRYRDAKLKSKKLP